MTASGTGIATAPVDSLFDRLAQRPEYTTEPRPDKTITATVETLDTDRALVGFDGTGLPLP